MFNKTLPYYLIVFTLLISACDFVEMKADNEESEEDIQDPIARVHDNFLYPEDLEGLVDSETSPEDSASRIERYVNSWIRNQLLIDEASTKMDFDEAEIERKILEYRYSLMGYEYQSYYINQNLNPEVNDEEILAYYEENIDNFPLRFQMLHQK